MRLLIRLVVNVLALMIVAAILPGFVVVDWTTAFIAAVVIGVINAFIRPILLFLTLPLTIVTLGIFALFLNVALLLTAAALVPGFSIDGLVTALLASILISLVSSFLGSLVR